MQPFTISILLTREEYAAAAAATTRRDGLLTAAGALLAAMGVLCRTFFDGFPLAAAWSLLLLGLLLAVSEWVLIPSLTRLNAAARYEQQEMLRQSVTATFSEEAVTVETARVSGTLPFSQLTATVETPALFQFTFGAELTLRVPHRLLTEEQITFLRTRKGR